MDLSAVVKYSDLFGNRITFYNEKMPKLYMGTLSMLNMKMDKN